MTRPSPAAPARALSEPMETGDGLLVRILDGGPDPAR